MSVIVLIGVVMALSTSPRAVAFVWDGEAFRRQSATEMTIPPPQAVQQADLDDDGALETVELRDGVLRLINDGQVVWQSDPAWDVTRFALQDVDNDGTLDIFFTLWKPDEAGVPRSHPFIYGWRRDAWRPLWFGSAVADPIRDFVVGDVDGDGRNELVVLEGLYGEAHDTPAHYVVVWRFNQWWFQNLWRSESGGYEGLGLKDVTGDGVPDIVTNLHSTTF